MDSEHSIHSSIIITIVAKGIAAFVLQVTPSKIAKATPQVIQQPSKPESIDQILYWNTIISLPKTYSAH